MNVWRDVNPKYITPEDFLAVTEIPKGSKNKYELDKEIGLLKLDRVLFTSTHYPQNYGFIPLTYADDDDPLDVLVFSNEPIYPLTLVRCFPIGILTMTDDNSMDEKIIAIPFGEPTYAGYRDINELPQHIFDEMKHFFTVYKQLEGKQTAVEHVLGREAAVEVIAKAIEHYKTLG